MKHFFEGGKLIQRKMFLYLNLLIWVNEAIPSRKYSIRSSAI